MANAIYPKYKEALLGGDSNISLANSEGTVVVSLIDTANNAYDANNQFYSDLDAADVIASANIENTTIENGLLRGDDVKFSSVSGDECEALLIWIDTTDPATSRLVAFLDTGVSGLPVSPNGSDIDIEWNVSGIFQL